MDLKPVQSSAVTHIGHDPEKKEMHVRFRGQKTVYIYPDISADKHASIISSPSIGKALAALSLKKP